MRVAFTTIQRGLLDRLGRVGQALSRTTSHIASGKRINQASEDGSGAARVAVAREELARIDSRRAAIVTVRGFLGATDIALDAVQDTLNASITEALKGFSDTDASVRGLIATQVDGLREQVLQQARTRFQGRYVFAGTDTLSDPFDAAGNYAGNSGTIEARIDDQLSIQVNLPGDGVFKAATDIPKALEDLSAGLRAGDTAAIFAAEGALKAAVGQISMARAAVGFRMQAIDAADLSLAARAVSISASLSSLEDADIATEITDAERLQTASQATLAVLSRTGNRSLFDYIA